MTGVLFLKSGFTALWLFATLAVGLGVLWTAILGIAMEGVWSALDEPWDKVLFLALAGFALLSGLALYGYLLARILRSGVGVPPDQIALHLATSGVAPIVLAVLLVWIVIANMRIGW